MTYSADEAATLSQVRELMDSRAFTDAEAALRDLIRRIETRVGVEAVELVQPLQLLAHARMKQRPWNAPGPSEEAPILERALELEARWNGESHRAMRIHDTLGMLFRAAGEFQLALLHIEHAVRHKEREFGPGVPLAHGLSALAEILLTMGAYERALAVYERACAMFSEFGEEPSAHLAFDKARCLLGLNRNAEALDQAELALRVYARRFGGAEGPEEVRALRDEARARLADDGEDA